VTSAKFVGGVGVGTLRDSFRAGGDSDGDWKQRVTSQLEQKGKERQLTLMLKRGDKRTELQGRKGRFQKMKMPLSNGAICPRERSVAPKFTQRGNAIGVQRVVTITDGE